jgi:hypothetical protein
MRKNLPWPNQSASCAALQQDQKRILQTCQQQGWTLRIWSGSTTIDNFFYSCALTTCFGHRHHQVRGALAHWIGGMLGRCFWSWRAMTSGRTQLRNRIAGALMHWMKGSMARAFTRWKEYVLHKVGVLNTLLSTLNAQSLIWCSAELTL